MLTEPAISESEGNHTQAITASRIFLTYTARALLHQISYHRFVWANCMLFSVHLFDIHLDVYVVDAVVRCPDPLCGPRYAFSQLPGVLSAEDP